MQTLKSDLALRPWQKRLALIALQKAKLAPNHTNLHPFCGVDSAAVQQANVERLVDRPQRQGVLLEERIMGGA